MKSLTKLGLIIALMMSALTAPAFADTTTKKPVKKHHTSKKKSSKKTKKASSTGVTTKKSEETAKLSTDINFNDSVLHGRYQTPDEATAKVENEKSLADLLAVRTQFKDRLKKSSEQN